MHLTSSSSAVHRPSRAALSAALTVPLTVALTVALTAALSAAPAPVARADASTSPVTTVTVTRSDDDARWNQKPLRLGQHAWGLRAGWHTRWLTSASAAVATQDGASGYALGVSRHLFTVDGRRPIDVRATATWAGYAAEGTMFGNLASEVSHDTLLAGVEARTPVWRRVTAAARVEVGAAHTQWRVTSDDGAMVAVDDAGWGTAAAVAVGLDVELIRRRSVATALGIEGQAAFGQAIGLQTDRPDVDEDSTLPRRAAELGSLGMSGWQLALAWKAAF